MITLDEFVSKWNGKGIDWDSHYGFQCVDLYRQYVQEVLGIPQSPGVVGAKNIWDSYLPEYYDRIPNTPEGIPEKGDIMIWGATYGQYGHVAVVTSATLTTFTCFSQNDPTGALCGKKTYRTYTPTLGWLHPKPKTIIYRGYDLTNFDSNRVAIDKLCDIMEGKYLSIDEHQKIINELTIKYADEKKTLEDKIRLLEELEETDHNWADTADTLERKLKAILGKFAGVGVSMSVENDEDMLAGQVSDYLTSAEADKNFILKILDENPEQTPDGILEALERLKLDEITIEELHKQIAILKEESPTIATIKIGSFIIKIYKK